MPGCEKVSRKSYSCARSDQQAQRQSSGEVSPLVLTLIALLTIMMASCRERSVSSMNCSAPPRRIIVQVFAFGQPVKKLYLPRAQCKKGYGDGEAVLLLNGFCTDTTVWEQRSSLQARCTTEAVSPYAVPLSDLELRRSRARQHTSEIQADPGKSTLLLLLGLCAKPVLSFSLGRNTADVSRQPQRGFLL